MAIIFFDTSEYHYGWPLLILQCYWFYQYFFSFRWVKTWFIVKFVNIVSHLGESTLRWVSSCFNVFSPLYHFGRKNPFFMITQMPLYIYIYLLDYYNKLHLPPLCMLNIDRCWLILWYFLHISVQKLHVNCPAGKSEHELGDYSQLMSQLRSLTSVYRLWNRQRGS